MKAAILGYGTVGSGVYEILKKNSDVIEANAGQPVDVKYVLDLREFPHDPVEEVLVHDIDTIINDPEVELVIETMGGTGAAYQFVKAALLAGKSACTSNKALVAKYGNELFELAKSHGRSFLFEASVGGGIPIIRPIYECLTAANISEITGILNGTTNFMLTKMALEGREYEDVLKEAQALGYAEKDPSADVLGYDTCRKIAILASMAFGGYINFENIETRGIDSITKADLEHAGALGYAVKLLGTARKENGRIYASVTPALVKKGHPLYSVNGVYNAIFVNSDVTGELMFYGSGAGKLPTASAVAADAVEIARNPGRTVYAGWDGREQTVYSSAEKQERYFVRFSREGRGVMDSALNAFGAEVFSDLKKDEGFALITAPMTADQYRQAAAGFEFIIQVIPVAD